MTVPSGETALRTHPGCADKAVSAKWFPAARRKLFPLQSGVGLAEPATQRWLWLRLDRYPRLAGLSPFPEGRGGTGHWGDSAPRLSSSAATASQKVVRGTSLLLSATN